MTKIYLIRHAEAEGNLYRRIQGHWDGSITHSGRGHAAPDGDLHGRVGGPRLG